MSLYGLGFVGQIVQTPGFVVMLTETYHSFRLIPTDGRKHREDFLLGQHALRRLGAAEHAIDDVFGRYESMLLEPEHDVRLARERADVNLLVASHHLRGHA